MTRLTTSGTYRLPGSLVGAGLEKHMGKKQAMALSTLATSLGILAFAFMSSQTGTMLVSVWISFQGTLMYAIICECLLPRNAIHQPKLCYADRQLLSSGLHRRVHASPVSRCTSRNSYRHCLCPIATSGDDGTNSHRSASDHFDFAAAVHFGVSLLCECHPDGLAAVMPPQRTCRCT